MAILHRAIFTWFIFLNFLILVCLRLESKTHWTWFLVFIPMWIFDWILLMYVVFHMISHCRTGDGERFRGTINKNVWYITAIGLKMSSQIIICIKLEYAKVNLPIYVVMCPIWILLVILVSHVFLKLWRTESRSYLASWILQKKFLYRLHKSTDYLCNLHEGMDFIAITVIWHLLNIKLGRCFKYVIPHVLTSLKVGGVGVIHSTKRWHNINCDFVQKHWYSCVCDFVYSYSFE